MIYRLPIYKVTKDQSMQENKSAMRGTKVPRHIAIIPDGNRRWARSHGLRLIEGYSLGVKKIIDVGNWARDFGVNTLTIWALSTENMKNRSKVELYALYKLYTRAAKDPKILAMLKDNRTSIKIIGNLEILPAFLFNALTELEAKTREYKEFTINLLVGYGGRDEIVNALSRICAVASQGKKVQIDEKLIESNMYSANIPDPDLIIRTSGEMRLSGLLPWQSSYSELYFEGKNWPDFGKNDLLRAIKTFSNRQRRFGR